jgi:hypothetical protein
MWRAPVVLVLSSHLALASFKGKKEYRTHLSLVTVNDAGPGYWDHIRLWVQFLAVLERFCCVSPVCFEEDAGLAE